MQDIQMLKKYYPLVIGGDADILRTICSPVGRVSNKIKKLGENMLRLMHAYDGVGLAAPQINQNLRMVAVTQRDTSKKNWKQVDQFVMINPRILFMSDVTEVDKEGCLSLPGEEGFVKRPQSITVQYTGLDSKKHIHKAIGFNARVILHELDHLDGVLFVDKLV